MPCAMNRIFASVDINDVSISVFLIRAMSSKQSVVNMSFQKKPLRSLSDLFKHYGHDIIRRANALCNEYQLTMLIGMLYP